MSIVFFIVVAVEYGKSDFVIYNNIVNILFSGSIFSNTQDKRKPFPYKEVRDDFKKVISSWCNRCASHYSGVSF